MNVARMSPPEDLDDRVAQAIPHRAPFRLVDRLVSAGPEGAIARRAITRDDPLVGDTLPRVLLVEAMAQTAALLAGGELGAHRGYLVALRAVTFEDFARVGDIVELHARHAGRLGALRRIAAEARVDGRTIARGELTVALEAG